ncbi:MAG TPA: hypothetical protein VK455_05835, partial [Thermoplasmata archaeon]|nr:hypothetical protein [Thermoplasmata archaeon]
PVNPQPLSGNLSLVLGVVSPNSAMGARPRDIKQFAVGPGKQQEIQLDDQWMFVEGKAVYMLTGCHIDGLTPNPDVTLEHPLASFTVFERSTFYSDRRRSWTTLLLAAVAAVASTIAAIAALHI